MKHEEEDELRLILFFLNCNAMLWLLKRQWAVAHTWRGGQRGGGCHDGCYYHLQQHIPKTVSFIPSMQFYFCAKSIVNSFLKKSRRSQIKNLSFMNWIILDSNIFMVGL
jgi:hypothetical protein